MTTELVELRLPAAASDMAQEEIVKQLAHLSKDLRDVSFADGGAVLQFQLPPDQRERVSEKALAVAQRIQRGLRTLERKVVYRSSTIDAEEFRGDGTAEGIHFLGLGQVALSGMPLRLFQYFDRVFEEIGSRAYSAEALRIPTLMPVDVLARCDYLRSFPHTVTFAAHLHEDAERIEGFRARHQKRNDLDEQALADMEPPRAGLSPAACYHAYHMNAGTTVPADGLTYGVCGKCFRYEASNLRDLRRLWDFTMREVVFLGGREQVLEKRARGVDLVGEFLESHRIAAEIRTASDPFFIAPDAVAKTYFQLSSDTKYEVAAALPNGQRLAVGSLNYHTDFFGRAFDVTVDGGGYMHSVCIAFGLERWVYAFLVQHGNDPRAWPEPVRTAPEFAGPEFAASPA